MMRGWLLCRLVCLVIFTFLFTEKISAQDTLKVSIYFETKGEEWVLQSDSAARNLYPVNENPTSGNQRLMAITRSGESPFSPLKKKFFIDNRLLVTFNRSVSRTEVEAFQRKYELQLINESGNGYSDKNPVYVFQYKNFTLSDNSATVSAIIAEQEKKWVKSAYPNRVNLFEPQSTNDTYIDYAWHIANSGQQISCSSLMGNHHADARIADAWEMGYTGQGIKVGVIDFFGFDYNHPDMQEQFLAGWDCINNTNYNASNFYFTQSNQAHGMAVSGIIAAKANNQLGSAGVAHGAKVVPFLIDGSEASVVLALQKAKSPDFDVDVVNCSFGSYFPSPAILAEIKNLQQNGRMRNGIAYGVVVIASHGNDHYNDIDFPQYPSAYDEVISVGASTPDDRKKTPGDAWETGSEWGTNYGSKLDIAAPGVCIFTTDLSGGNGYAPGDYIAFQKTSAAAPIVSGIAALLLSKNPATNWQDVRNRLTQTADKVQLSSQGGLYNYQYDLSKPGHSLEVGYGRINAYNALADTPVGISKEIQPDNDSRFIVSPFVQNYLDIQYSLNEQYASYEMAIMDMSGRVLAQVRLPAGHGSMNFDVSNLMPGMYLVRCISGSSLISNDKFVKVQ